MIDGGDSDEERSFTLFFESIHPSLISQAYVLSGDQQEARDLAQETLSRAWQKWDTVSRYENPAAWTRAVLHNLAIGRWRRFQVRRRYERGNSLQEVEAPDADRIDLVRALRRLPANQARALVLHDLVGLSTSEVAVELRADPGTVRVWLHRGRLGLAAALGWGEPDDRHKKEAKSDVRSRES
ncbi:MAG: sigma-70 family RNA polymerase sigma factor [Acidimicrobiales bacterium]